MVVGLYDVTSSAVAPRLTTGRRSPKFLPEMAIVLANRSACALSITTASGGRLSGPASRSAGKQHASTNTSIETEKVTVLIKIYFLRIPKSLEHNITPVGISRENDSKKS